MQASTLGKRRLYIACAPRLLGVLQHNSELFNGEETQDFIWQVVKPGGRPAGVSVGVLQLAASGRVPESSLRCRLSPCFDCCITRSDRESCLS